jgi:hypothetical protein
MRPLARETSKVAAGLATAAVLGIFLAYAVTTEHDVVWVIILSCIEVVLLGVLAIGIRNRMP